MGKLSTKSLFLKAIKDSSFYFIADIASRIISIGIIPLLTRIVTVKEFAIYDMFIIVSNILVMFSTLGMDSGAVIIIAENINNKNVLSAVLGLQLTLNTLILAFLALLAYSIIFSGIKINIFFSVFQLTCLFLYSFTYLTTYNTFNFLRWTGKAKKASVVNFLLNSIGILTGFFILYLSKNRNIDLFLLGLTLGSSIGLFLSFYLLKEYILTVNFSAIKQIQNELFKLSIPYIPVYIGNYFMRIIDRLIVINFLGSVALGYYAFASRLSNIPQQILFIFYKGFRPIIFQNYKNEPGKKLAKKFYEIYMFLIPLELISIILLTKPIIFLFGGNKYYNSIPLVPILLLSTLYLSSLYFDGLGYNIRRKTYLIPILAILTIIINTIVSIFLVKKINILGVAIGTLISSIFFAFSYSFCSEKLYPLDYNFKKIIQTTVGSIVILLFWLIINIEV